jgi:hypothetical protein
LLCDYFDLIGGTSTGSIVAAGLACGMTVGALQELYRNIGASVFQPQAGYNYVLPSNVLLGLEADVSFQNTLESNSVISSLSSGPNSVVEKMDFLSTARGRIGQVLKPGDDRPKTGAAISHSSSGSHALRSSPPRTAIITSPGML